jgi:hypothetical protein
LTVYTRKLAAVVALAGLLALGPFSMTAAAADPLFVGGNTCVTYDQAVTVGTVSVEICPAGPPTIQLLPRAAYTFGCDYGVRCTGLAFQTYGYGMGNFYARHLGGSQTLVLRAQFRCLVAFCQMGFTWKPPDITWRGSSALLFGIGPTYSSFGAYSCLCGTSGHDCSFDNF